MKKLHPNLHALLENCLLREEEPATQVLINKLRHVNQGGYFTKAELLEMCKWKDPRELRRKDLQSNAEKEVIETSRQVFASKDEYRRMIFLDSLKGVGVPVASAVLTLTDPANYGVIDIRVWQVLYLYGQVTYTPEGQGLELRHWMDYLTTMREHSGQFQLPVRTLERSLFEHHKTIQEGTLY